MKGGLLLNKFLKGAGFYLLLLIIIVTIVEFAGTPTETVKELNFSQVYKYVTEDGAIVEIPEDSIKWWKKAY